jgi:hypothetical protein
VRWDRLFADLEAQLAAEQAAEFAGEVTERSRLAAAEIRLVDRLRGALDHPIRLATLGGETCDGVLRRVGSEWLLVDERLGVSALVPLTAVTGVEGLGSRSAAPGSEGQVTARLGLRYALRGIARDRAPTRLSLADGTFVTGTIDRVGADYLDLAEHAAGEARRPAAVRSVRAIPVSALAVVRTT